MGRLARSLIWMNLAAMSGCQFYCYGVNNIAYEIHRCLDDKKSAKSVEKMAADAWKEFCSKNTQETFSRDYEAGFISGFTYSVWRGGNGEPPAVPPGGYWKEQFRTPDGQARVQNWFNGYRQGAQTALISGYRNHELLPLSRPLQEETRADMYRAKEATLAPPRPVQDPAGLLPAPMPVQESVIPAPAASRLQR